jgi:cupin 2 domain-containing protein
MNAVSSLLHNTPVDLAAELCDTLLVADEARIERIVSRGNASPPGFWYDQPDHEWVLLVAGAARLSFDSEEHEVELKPGDYLNIPAHQRHRVEWTDPTQPTIWLTIRYSDSPAAPG